MHSSEFLREFNQLDPGQQQRLQKIMELLHQRQTNLAGLRAAESDLAGARSLRDIRAGRLLRLEKVLREERRAMAQESDLGEAG